MQWLEPGLHCNRHKLEVSTLHETLQKKSTLVTHILLFHKTNVLQTAGKRCHISGVEHDNERKMDPAASLVQEHSTLTT